jgi:hypothetical protein
LLMMMEEVGWVNMRDDEGEAVHEAIVVFGNRVWWWKMDIDSVVILFVWRWWCYVVKMNFWEKR